MSIDKSKRVYFNLPTPVARLSFPELKEKVHVMLNGQVASRATAYRATFLIPKKLEGKELELFTALQEAVKVVAQKAWPLSASSEAAGDKWGYPAGFKSPFLDGDVTKPGKEANEAAKGHWLLRCASQREVALTNGTVRPIRTLTGDSIGELYAGCYVRGELGPYPYVFGDNVGISFGFTQVIKYSEGEALGERVNSPQETFGGLLPSEKPEVSQEPPKSSMDGLA